MTTQNDAISNEEERESSTEEESLKDLPQKFRAHVQTGDFALKEMEQYGKRLQSANDRYQSHLLFYISFLVITLAVVVLVYFLYFRFFVEMIVGVIVALLLELLFLFRSDTFNIAIPTSGENWKNFRKLFLYDLSNVNSFFRMITKKIDHERLVNQFRRKSLYVLRRFGLLEITGVERAVEVFDSSSDEELTMIAELTRDIEKLGIKKVVFELFYNESPYPNNEVILEEIKNNKENFQSLLKMLTETGTVKIEPISPFDLDILSSILMSADNFSLEQVRIKLADNRLDVRRIEKNIGRLIEIYFPGHVIQNINEGISFKDVASLKINYITRLSKVYKVDPEVIWYFFHSLDPSAEGEVFIANHRNNGKFLEDVCKCLLNEGIIRSRSRPSELVEILKGAPRLSPEALQIKVSNYEETFVFTREFRDFIVGTEAIHKMTSLDIETVFNLCNQFTDGIDRMFQISSKLTEEFDLNPSPFFSLYPEAKVAISEALLAIYLYRKQSPYLESICSRISSHENSVGILYEYAILSDTERTSSDDLDKLILRAISKYDHDKTVTDRYYLQFREKLGAGVLYTSIMRLDSYVMGELRDQVGQISSKISDVVSLHIFKQSLRELLDDTLIGSKIGSLLEYGTVGAFILTKDPKSRGYVLPLIDEIAANNDIMLDTGSGEHTRFGMVPFGTSFENFSEYFENLYKKEASKPKYKDIFGSTTLNIYKFVPSRSFTKVIGISPESAVIEAIGNIIKAERFPESDKISILASLTGESDSHRSVGHIIKDAVNGINLIEFAIEKAATEKFSLRVLSKVPLDNRLTFNTGLLQHFSTKTVSSLSKLIYRGAVSNENRIFQRFANGVFQTLNRSNITNELRNDIEFLFEKLKALGYVLDNI